MRDSKAGCHRATAPSWTTPPRALSGPESNREATGLGATRSHSQRRRLEHSTPTPTCAAPTQRPGLAVVHAFGAAGNSSVLGLGASQGRGVPFLAWRSTGDRMGRRRGAVEAISAKARGWLTARVERGPTRPAHICYCRATGCPSSPRPGIEVTDLTVGRPAQPARRSDHAGPQPTVLPPGAPSAEET